jgi:hypothetical protein
MRLSNRFGKNQPVPFAVEIENLSVAAPVHRRVELPLYFILAKVLVEDVIEKFL